MESTPGIKFVCGSGTERATVYVYVCNVIRVNGGYDYIIRRLADEESDA